jgi:hypothetical protein
MASGWTRWMLEQFEFDFQLVFPPELDKGQLAKRYDVLVFPGGAISQSLRSRKPRDPDKTSVPEEYHDRLGSVSFDKTLPQLRAFAEQGGTILAIGGSTSLARLFEIPVHSALTTPGENGAPQPLSRDKFYVPGSILRVRVDTANPLALGMREHVDVFFRRNPVFDLSPEAVVQGVRPVAWFDSATPLRSGWAWGQHYLEDAIAVAEVPMGKGSLVLFGPEVAFRAQSHGAFKFLFNGIYRR